MAGAFFAKSLKTAELIYLFASLAAFLALKMILPLEKYKLGTELPSGFLRFLSPGIIGFFSSVMGVGGGSFSVPYLTMYNVPIQRAVGTASLIGLVISVCGGMGYLLGGWGIAGMPVNMAGFIHLPSLVMVAVAAVLCAPFGASVAHAIPKRVLSIVFGLFLILATIRLLLSV